MPDDLSDLTADKLDELIALAEKATQGKRTVFGENEFNARLAAACDPDTIRSLVRMARWGMELADGKWQRVYEVTSPNDL